MTPFDIMLWALAVVIAIASLAVIAFLAALIIMIVRSVKRGRTARGEYNIIVHRPEGEKR
ncbi:hypothetical protein ACFY9N_11595 [Microbacterium sp. NPDC008134]|uniref:hypothetical protein n=1 Tax=Microbacterium sp. NPDC008134 TaxID=3364183 RepID=UPI0036F03D98